MDDVCIPYVALKPDVFFTLSILYTLFISKTACGDITYHGGKCHKSFDSECKLWKGNLKINSLLQIG